MTGCSHLDPYENVDRVGSASTDARRLLPDLPPPTDPGPAPAFVGTMPAALADVDTLRRALMQTSASMAGERAVYDAALWTLTPYMLYRVATRGAGSQDARNTLVGGAALLGAGYGFLNARPKEYEEIYLNGTDRLTCLMVDYTRYLYTADDFKPAWTGAAGPEWEAFAEAIRNYRAAAYEASRAMVELPSAPGNVTCATASDCSARQRALGTPAPNRKTAAAALQAEADSHANQAQRKLTQLRRLTSQVRYEAAIDLRAESRQVMADIDAQLHARRPDMVTVTAAIKALRKSVDEIVAAKAQSDSRRQERDAGTGALRPLLLPRSLDPKIKQRVRDAESALLMQLARAEAVLAMQEDKAQRVDQLYARMACPAKVQPPSASAQGSRANGGKKTGNPGSTGTTAGGGTFMVPSETRLP